MDGGEYCAIWLGPEMPGDQQADDAKSVCFDSAPLGASIDIVGAPVIRLKIAADKPVAMVAVRLCDVLPGGASTRITYGVFNLCHRESHEFPKPVVSGEMMEIAFKLDDIAYQVPAGHRLRVAISSSYWPMVWPSPEAVQLTLHSGAIDLPERAQGKGDEVHFAEPEAARPWSTQTVRPASNSRKVERDQATGAVTLSILDDFGETRDARPWAGERRHRSRKMDDPSGRSALRSRRHPLDLDPVARRLVGAHRDLLIDALGCNHLLPHRPHRGL